MATSRCYYGAALLVTGEVDRGAEMARLGAEAAGRLGLYPLVGEGLGVLAISHAVAGDFDAEREMHLARLAVAREHGDVARTADALGTLAEIALDEADARPARARTPRRRSPSPSPTLPMEARVALITLARAAVVDGRPRRRGDDPRRAFEAAEKIGQKLVSPSATGSRVAWPPRAAARPRRSGCTPPPSGSPRPRAGPTTRSRPTCRGPRDGPVRPRRRTSSRASGRSGPRCRTARVASPAARRRGRRPWRPSEPCRHGGRGTPTLPLGRTRGPGGPEMRTSASVDGAGRHWSPSSRRASWWWRRPGRRARCRRAATITWDGGATTDRLETTDNWTPQGIRSAGTSSSASAITSRSHGAPRTVDQLHLGGAAPSCRSTGGSSSSTARRVVWALRAPTASPTLAQVGGTGTIRCRAASIFLASATTFVLGPDHAGPAAAGRRRHDRRGRAPSSARWARVAGYQVDVAGADAQPAARPWLSADPGTAMTIQPGGTLRPRRRRRLLPGAAVAGQSLGTLVNNGVLRRPGGTAPSVVERNYSRARRARSRCRLLRHARAPRPSADQRHGRALARAWRTGTVRRGGPTTSCIGQRQQPRHRPMSVALTIPAPTRSRPACRSRSCRRSPGRRPPGIGNEVLAHADNLTADTATPAHDRPPLLPGRRDGHAAGRGPGRAHRGRRHEVLLPDCVSGALPAGLCRTCVVRPATPRPRTNTFVTVLTTQTQPVAPAPQPARREPGAPTAPQGLAVKEAAPFDGTALGGRPGLAPASRQRRGSVAAYRVCLDGAVVSSPTGSTSVVVKDPGPGEHTISGGRGQRRGVRVRRRRATTTVDELSKPRKVNEVQGEEGRQADGRARSGRPRPTRAASPSPSTRSRCSRRTARRSTPRSSRPAS